MHALQWGMRKSLHQGHAIWTSNIFPFVNGLDTIWCTLNKSIPPSIWQTTSQKHSIEPFFISTLIFSLVMFPRCILLSTTKLLGHIRINLLQLNVLSLINLPPPVVPQPHGFTLRFLKIMWGILGLLLCYGMVGTIHHASGIIDCGGV